MDVIAALSIIGKDIGDLGKCGASVTETLRTARFASTGQGWLTIRIDPGAFAYGTAS